jgi:solute carrier family 27 (fatty acid transporter), member 1/4
MRKVDWQKEGYNPAVLTDRLYYLDPKLEKYLPLGVEEYEKIISGEIRLWYAPGADIK